jgi:hypothetical protein
LRVHQKKTSLMPGDLNNAIIFETQIDYKRIYEDIKNYVVFKISITTNLNNRLAYLDVLDYLEKVSVRSR